MYRNSASSIGSFDLIPPTQQAALAAATSAAAVAPVTPFAFQYARHSPPGNHNGGLTAAPPTALQFAVGDRASHLRTSASTPLGNGMEIDSPLLMLMFSPAAAATTTSSTATAAGGGIAKAMNELSSVSAFQWPRTYSDHEWANFPRFSDADSLPAVTTPVASIDGGTTPTAPLVFYPSNHLSSNNNNNNFTTTTTTSINSSATGANNNNTMMMMMTGSGGGQLPTLGYASEESPSSSDAEEAMLLAATTEGPSAAAAAAVVASLSSSSTSLAKPVLGPSPNRKRSIASSLSTAVTSAATSFGAVIASSLKRTPYHDPTSANFSAHNHDDLVNHHGSGSKRMRRKKQNAEFVEDYSSNEEDLGKTEKPSLSSNSGSHLSIRRRRPQSPLESSLEPSTRRRAAGGVGRFSPAALGFFASGGSSSSSSSSSSSMVGHRGSQTPQAYGARDTKEEEVDEEAGDEGEEDGEVDSAMLLTNFNPADVELIARQAAEDTEQSKQRNWPGVWNAIVTTAANHEGGAVGAILSAFTENGKMGRELPTACSDLLTRAVQQVAQARKEQRSKMHAEAAGGAPPQVFHPEADAQGKYPCAKCNKIYNTSEGLRLHNRNHHDIDKKWMCLAPQCEGLRKKSFARQADLKMHVIRMHSPVRPFPCRVVGCPKSFACFSELRRHVATIHGDLVNEVNAAVAAARSGGSEESMI